MRSSFLVFNCSRRNYCLHLLLCCCLQVSHRLVLIKGINCENLWFCLFPEEKYHRSWENQPVMTSLETTGKDIAGLDFPAITICSQGSISEVRARIQMRGYTKDYCTEFTLTCHAGVQQRGRVSVQ